MRAFWGFRVGLERREESLCFLVGGWWLLVVKVKQPRWRRRMKRERNLWKSVDMLAIRVKGVRDELSSYRVSHEGGEEVIRNEMR